MEVVTKFFDANGLKRGVRVTQDATGRAMFSAYDVAALLGYKDHKDAVDTHCRMGSVYQEVETKRGAQSLRMIYEPDLYRLIIGSKKPEAMQFEQWVFEEVLPSIRQTGEYVNADLKAKIAALRSNNEDLEAENRDMQATLCHMGVTYQQLYTIEHAILRHITNAPGQHSSAALEYLVHRDVKCTNSDYWHAMSDLYNRYKIRQNRAGFWELAR